MIRRVKGLRSKFCEERLYNIVLFKEIIESQRKGHLQIFEKVKKRHIVLV